MAAISGFNIGLNFKGILNLGSTINTPLSTTLQAITDGDGVASPLQLATTHVAIGSGTFTGTGRLRFPDAGTTAADGIAFGSGSSNIYRITTGTLRTDGTFQIAGTRHILTFNGYQMNPDALTGSSATSALNISQTWNTTGSPSLIYANVTNTASGASSMLINLQLGGANRFRVFTDGSVVSNAYFGFVGQRILLGGNIDNYPGGLTNPSVIRSAGTGLLTLSNSAENDFNRLQFGGTNNTYPALKRNGTTLQVRLADDSGDAGLTANNINFGTTTGTGRINLPDAGTTAADGISFGATHSIFKSGATLYVTASTNNSSITLNDGVIGTRIRYSNSWVGVLGNNLQFNAANTSVGIWSSNELLLTPSALTGSQATSALSLTQTWNTTGTPTLIFANVTNTASGSGSNLMDLQVGGITLFRVSRSGVLSVFDIAGVINMSLANGGNITYGTRSKITAPADGQLLLTNQANTDFSRLQFGGTTNAFPSLKRNGTEIHFRLADDSGFSGTTAQWFTAGGIIMGNAHPRLYTGNGAADVNLTMGSNSVKITNGISSANSTVAILELESTNKGFLPPRMTTAQKNAIVSPAAGLMVYDTSLNQMSYYNGSTWFDL